MLKMNIAAKQLIKVLVFFITALSLYNCSSLSVNTDYDLKTDFANYHTYDWLPNPTEDIIDELNNGRFITALENKLAEKGFILDTHKPDFIIATHYEKENKTNVTAWDYPYFIGNYHSYGHGHHGHGYSSSFSYSYSNRINTYEYEQGTLVLDFIDAKTQALFWRAVAKDALKPSSTPQEKIKEIEAAVNKILENFPPKKVTTQDKI